MTQEEKDKLVESRKKKMRDFWSKTKIKETPLIGYDEPDYNLSIGKGKKED